MTSKDLLVSIIITVKDESEGIDIFFERLIPILDKLPTKYEIVFVNDGSNDDTLDLLLVKQQNNNAIRVIDLSRNFGKESALYAGFEHCSGDAAISIDSDLQDPPELILEMVFHWLDGYEVVTAVRENRDTDTATKKGSAGMFYKVMNQISETKLTQMLGIIDY